MSFEVPKETLPRTGFTTKVKIANVEAGSKAYVAVAAVDLGILNITRFQTPDPDGWYFGQRQLGVEFRDLYGLLIDPTQGDPGALRSGGDGDRLAPVDAAGDLGARSRSIRASSKWAPTARPRSPSTCPTSPARPASMAMAWTETRSAMPKPTCSCAIRWS